MFQRDLRKWKEPVGRLEFPQVAGPEVWQVCLLFLIPRCLRRRFVAGLRQNTNVVFSGRRKPAKSRVGWAPFCVGRGCTPPTLSLIHISEPTRLGMISYAVFCLKKKKKRR